MSDWPETPVERPVPAHDPGAESSLDPGADLSLDPGADLSLDPGAEPVEWVDEDGAVIEVVTRHRMRAEGLRHRCTYVVVIVGPADRFVGGVGRLRRDDELVVHQRADWKDVAAGHWDLAFGGVCGVGEEWESSARRELAEEAGIELGPDRPLIDLGPLRYDEPAEGADPGTAIVGWAYLASWPDRPVPVDGEAVAFDRVPLGELAAWIRSVPVCRDSATVVAPAILARVAGQG